MLEESVLVCTLGWSGEDQVVLAPSGVHESHGIETDLSNQCIIRHHHSHTAKQHLHMYSQDTPYT